MILTFADVITVEEQHKILTMIEHAAFVDGHTTAGAAAARFRGSDPGK